MTQDPVLPGFVVRQSVGIVATPQQLWAVLVSPAAEERWRGAEFETDWKAGSRIAITADIGGKRYRDKGEVLRVEPCAMLQYSYWSRVSGLPDVPASYSVITLSIRPDGDQTLLDVEQQVPPSPVRRGKDWVIGPDSGAKHVDFYWRSTLAILKREIERSGDRSG